MIKGNVVGNERHESTYEVDCKIDQLTDEQRLAFIQTFETFRFPDGSNIEYRLINNYMRPDIYTMSEIQLSIVESYLDVQLAS